MRPTIIYRHYMTFPYFSLYYFKFVSGGPQREPPYQFKPCIEHFIWKVKHHLYDMHKLTNCTLKMQMHVWSTTLITCVCVRVCASHHAVFPLPICHYTSSHTHSSWPPPTRHPPLVTCVRCRGCFSWVTTKINQIKTRSCAGTNNRASTASYNSYYVIICHLFYWFINNIPLHLKHRWLQ